MSDLKDLENNQPTDAQGASKRLNLEYGLPPLVEAQRQGWITSAQAAAVVVRLITCSSSS